jgi:hypothetical protein
MALRYLKVPEVPEKEDRKSFLAAVDSLQNQLVIVRFKNISVSVRLQPPLRKSLRRKKDWLQKHLPPLQPSHPSIHLSLKKRWKKCIREIRQFSRTAGHQL